MDANEEIFSLHSNEITQFASTWNLDRNVSLAEKSTETMSISSKTDAGTVTAIRQDIATQTDQSLVGHTNKAIVNENQLAKWLARIYPLVAAELQNGVTNVFELSSARRSSANDDSIIYAVQTVRWRDTLEAGTLQLQGYAAWMSVVTNSAPALVVTASPVHSSWCDHETSHIKLFQPVRNKETGAMSYVEHQTLPSVKSCVQALATNPYDKDMLAAGTFSGDLHIWRYDGQTNNNADNLVQLPADTSQHGTIVDIAWLQTANNNQYAVLSCHEGGVLVLWKIGAHVLRDKVFQICSRANSNEVSRLTVVEAVSHFEFVVGTDNGKVLLCSIQQAVPIAESKHLFDPVVMELEAQDYEISSLLVQNHQNEQLVVISCDISGAVLMRYMQKDIHEPCGVIKLPLSIAHKIVCTPDLRYILSPGANGAMDVLSVSSTARKTVVGKCSGPGNVVRLSDNGCWAVTGCYDGQFQLFKIESNTGT